MAAVMAGVAARLQSQQTTSSTPGVVDAQYEAAVKILSLAALQSLAATVTATVQDAHPAVAQQAECLRNVPPSTLLRLALTSTLRQFCCSARGVRAGSSGTAHALPKQRRVSVQSSGRLATDKSAGGPPGADAAAAEAWLLNVVAPTSDLARTDLSASSARSMRVVSSKAQHAQPVRGGSHLALGDARSACAPTMMQNPYHRSAVVATEVHRGVQGGASMAAEGKATAFSSRKVSRAVLSDTGAVSPVAPYVSATAQYFAPRAGDDASRKHRMAKAAPTVVRAHQRTHV
ncbi:MAG: hypothetical protein EOO41_05360 [Methanobacteriota archaeon]|nr:MAG: hypothetical protein EOO41_05360 [Euryarchaeota archaeon]